MTTVPKIESKELGMVSFENQKILDKNIFPNVQNFVVVDPIDSKRVSKFTNNLTVKSAKFNCEISNKSNVGICRNNWNLLFS
jgi:hypothetical protein